MDFSNLQFFVSVQFICDASINIKYILDCHEVVLNRQTNYAHGRYIFSRFNTGNGLAFHHKMAKDHFWFTAQPIILEYSSFLESAWHVCYYII